MLRYVPFLVLFVSHHTYPFLFNNWMLLHKLLQASLSDLRLSFFLTPLLPLSLPPCYSEQRKVCRACYQVIESYLKGDSRKNENYLARFIKFFQKQVGACTCWHTCRRTLNMSTLQVPYFILILFPVFSNTHTHINTHAHLYTQSHVPAHSNLTRSTWGLMLKRWWLKWLRTMRKSPVAQCSCHIFLSVVSQFAPA